MKKPADLKIPSYEERKPCIVEGFLVVPSNYSLHDKWSLPSFSDPQIFNNSNDVFVEYCSGNGQWILEKARQNPNINWVGVEKRFDRSRKIWVKKHNMELNNLFVVYGEGLTFTKYYLKENSISSIFINFPDPWPKNCHIKNRLVNTPFMEELSRVIKPMGNATFVTDDDKATEWIIKVVSKEKQWRSSYEKPYFTYDFPDYGDSYFKDLWVKKGLQIKYMQWQNQKL